MTARFRRVFLVRTDAGGSLVISLIGLVGVGEERGDNLTSWAGPWIRRLTAVDGIVVRHVGSACGGDTTLVVYKLRVVAVEEGLFVLKLVSWQLSEDQILNNSNPGSTH